MKGEKYNPEVEKCSGCLRCQMVCAFAYTKTFNLTKSRIIVNRSFDQQISFTEDCIECDLCANSCTYGALTA